jgi:hypothetical protein
MTIGVLREEAHTALRATATAMRGQQAATVAEVSAAIAARSAVYAQLARVTELVAGGRPADEMMFRPGASSTVGDHGRPLARFYAGLESSAAAGQGYPVTAAATHSSVRSLTRAADTIGVIGDIIASHVVPNQRPGTPEGAAIRAGGGVQAALGNVARLTLDAIIVDQRLLAWAGRGVDSLSADDERAMDTVLWVTESRLGAVARDLLAAAQGQPTLLDELDVARQPLDPAPAVTSADEAVAAVTAARTWLGQHPEQVTVAHLQVGTQIGLAVHTLTGSDPLVLRQWRGTAIAALDLRDTPAIDIGRNAVGELIEVLRWARSQLDPGQQESEERVAQLARLGDQLPALANTMYRGLRHAVARNDLFVRDAVLRKPVGSVIYRAIQRWRPALRADDPLPEISRNLWRLHSRQRESGPQEGLPSSTAAAFPHPPRPSSAAPGDTPAPIPATEAVPPRRSR